MPEQRTMLRPRSMSVRPPGLFVSAENRVWHPVSTLTGHGAWACHPLAVLPFPPPQMRRQDRALMSSEEKASFCNFSLRPMFSPSKQSISSSPWLGNSPDPVFSQEKSKCGRNRDRVLTSHTLFVCVQTTGQITPSPLGGCLPEQL